MATRAARKPPHTSIDELEEQATIEEQLLEPGKWEAGWKAECEKEQATFWDKLSLIPKHAQHELLLYLYRLEPRTYNKQGDPSYQSKYSLPLTLEQVQEDFGGGRYEIYLKRGRRTLAGKYIFSISGQARFKEGQTDATGKPLTSAAPVASESRGSELSEALKAIVPLLKNDNGQRAADASIEVMKTGMTTALGMQRDAAGAPNELLTKLVDRALSQPQGPDAITLLEKFISIGKSLTPQPVAQNPNPNNLEAMDSQFGIVEKLTGKTMTELLSGDGRPAKLDPWAGVVTALVSVAPTLLREFRVMKFEQMQWQAHLASKGISVNPTPPNLPADVQPPPSPNQPPPSRADTTVSAGSREEQVIAGVVNTIITYFKGGWDGYACASAIAVNFKEALPFLAPFLSSRPQVDAFIAQTPALASLATELRSPEHETWPDFVDHFFWTLNPDQAPEDEEEDEDVPDVHQAEPTRPRTRKKKGAAVGQVV